MHAPDVRLSIFGGGASVGDVVFASARDGWLYGPGLYATRDGGAHWHRIVLPGIIAARGGGVTALAVSAGIAYAIVSPDPVSSTPAELFTSPAGRDAWTRVTKVTPGGAFAVSGRSAWFAGSTHLWSTADGVRWQRYPAGPA